MTHAQMVMAAMKDKKAKWHTGSRKKGDIKAVFDELLRIHGKNGKNFYEDIVRSARKTGNPLHGQFTWGNRIAADKFRIEEARQLIKSIDVVWYEKGESKEMRAREFFSISRAHIEGRTTGGSSSDVGKFAIIEEVMISDTLLREQTCEAIRQLDNWRRRYAWLDALESLVNAIDVEVAKINAKLRASKKPPKKKLPKKKLPKKKP